MIKNQKFLIKYQQFIIEKQNSIIKDDFLIENKVFIF